MNEDQKYDDAVENIEKVINNGNIARVSIIEN